MIFHLDENMPRAIAEGLRRRGHDVTIAADSDLIGASDQDHLDFARRNHRVLVRFPKSDLNGKSRYNSMEAIRPFAG